MASVNSRQESGLLYIDFRFRGVRCREQTLLPDTPANRKRLEALCDRVQRAIDQNTFSFEEYFPNSRRVKMFAAPAGPASVGSGLRAPDMRSDIPTFREFSALWISENEPRWRDRYRKMIGDRLERRLLPTFADLRLCEIDRPAILAFRAELAKMAGRGESKLSAKTINKHMILLKAILTEGCTRFGLSSPVSGVRPLKQKRTEIHPFTLEEVETILTTVRADFRTYLTVRFFTGLRTGEADGLCWDDIDFDGGTITIRRTHDREGDGEVKTDASLRTLPMFPRVREALKQQKAAALPGATWVFTTPRGHPIDAVNFANRVWYPLLRYLGLKHRPPYQMRHTAATLMLASGENPEWVARTLGHSTTEMLFRVYSRYVPNLTRNDGRAFTGLVESRLAPDRAKPSLKDIESLPPDQLRVLLADAMRRLEGTSKES